MEPFKKDIETEGAGSFVMPKQPSMKTLKSKFNFNLISVMNTPTPRKPGRPKGSENKVAAKKVTAKKNSNNKRGGSMSLEAKISKLAMLRKKLNTPAGRQFAKYTDEFNSLMEDKRLKSLINDLSNGMKY